MRWADFMTGKSGYSGTVHPRPIEEKEHIYRYISAI